MSLCPRISFEQGCPNGSLGSPKSSFSFMCVVIFWSANSIALIRKISQIAVDCKSVHFSLENNKQKTGEMGEKGKNKQVTRKRK